MALDYEKFVRSDYNTLINVVSSSADSKVFLGVDKYNHNILSPVQINDGKYQDPVYTYPRYDGSKSTSKTYTFFTEGDNSYGKNAAIDINTIKFAWSNNINEKNLNFYDKTTVNIKYLIDATGSVIELSRKNYNLFEVQNTFKKGDNVQISLTDKYNPTNQANLDGDKIIFESGYSYSPIIFRETNETLNFLYLKPKSTTTTRIGTKAVAESDYVFYTIGNADTDFTHVTSTNTFFKKDGTIIYSQPFSLNKFASTQWPYSSQLPLTIAGKYKRYDGTTFTDPNPGIDNGVFRQNDYTSHYYTLDYFLTNKSGSANGGYENTDVAALKINVLGGEYYEYYQAQRDSDYMVNVNIPINMTFATNPDSGASTIKIVGIIEYQAAGTTSWQYRTATNMRINRLPETSNVGVDEQNSFIFMDISPGTGFQYIQFSCILNDYKVTLAQGDKIRLKVFFAEMRNFFIRTEGIYFELQNGDSSKAFFEVWDAINTGITPVANATIQGTSTMFTLGSDNQTLLFDTDSSLLYDNVSFIAPDASNPASVSNYYSPVEAPFHFEIGDIIRFTSYYSINPDIYIIEQINEPKINQSGTTSTVLVPLSVKLDRKVNPANVNTRTFAFLKKKEDETTILINFKKTEGQTSNALVIPFNLDTNIKKDIANIIAPLKDTVLSKVLVIS
jgi:hypothetical protein